MIIEIDDLCFDWYSPSQLAAVRPDMERLASIMRRNLRLLDGVLGVEVSDSALGRKHELALAELRQAQAQIDALEHDLATARAWIEHLQQRLAALEDDEQDTLYASVGLTVTAHDVVVSAARRALLQHHHPDRWRPEEKTRATERFAAVSATFDRIAELRR
ncbi:molecular chaperone DnaJ [Methylobacterium sp. DM1]|nr:molecular chaperone DnaJ [Methylobacterium sp. DM1]